MRASPKMVVMIDSASTTNGETATGNCDTLGADFAEIAIKLGTANVTSNNPSVFNLLECDTTVASSFVTVSGFVGDTDWTIPASDTSNPNLYLFRVDCRARMRYLRLAISPTTTQIVDAVALLFRQKEGANSAADAGTDVLVEG